MATSKNFQRQSAESKAKEIIPGNGGVTEAPPTAQAEKLLQALQSLILPLIQGAVFDGRVNSQAAPANDASWTGPEASNFLLALRQFIASVVCAQEGHRSQKLANSEEGDEIDIKTIQEQSNVPLAVQGGDTSTSVIQPSLVKPSNIITRRAGTDHALRSQRPRILRKVLDGLRQHAFNTMPIRLLYFEYHGADLRITLVERGSIYARLEEKLVADFDEANFRSDIEEMNSDKTSGDTDYEAAVIEKWVAKTTQYAILSHTWIRAVPGEITYTDWNNGTFNTEQAGYQKLFNFCKASTDIHGLSFGWMDTVCINKESSTELDESIRSMYKWYRNANVCITYLAETAVLEGVPKDPWFTRGWTLQELIAPEYVKFYDMDWKRLVPSSTNDKQDSMILEQIELATTITVLELLYVPGVSISRRMQWAAKREVTREEDGAYSLMGIFDVSISIAYGEGSERAFFRLLREILSTSDNVLDMFNWAGELPSSLKHISSIIPSGPGYYNKRTAHIQVDFNWPLEPITLTHLGVRIPILLMPAVSIQTGQTSMQGGPLGYYFSTVPITAVVAGEHSDVTTYSVLDRGAFRNRDPQQKFQVSFGVLNFGGYESKIRISKFCFAVALFCEEAAGMVTGVGSVKKISTKAPIIFELQKKQLRPVKELRNYYEIEKAQLVNHGMQIVSLSI